MRIKTSLILVLALLTTLVSGVFAQTPPPGFIPFSTFAALPASPGRGTTRFVSNTDGAGCNGNGSTIVMCYYDGATWAVAGTGTFTISGASTALHYVTTQAEGTLSAEFSLGSLADGSILKCSTASSVCTPTAATQGTDYYKPGGTDVAIADGGTGSSTASGARSNLGLAIGTNVQAFSQILTDIAAVTSAVDKLLMYDGANWVVVSVPSCSDSANSKLLYSTSTHAFSCGVDQNSGGGSGGAPTDAHYVTTTAESGLSAEANLGALSTGVLFCTVASSTCTITVKTIGSDIQAYSAGLADIAGMSRSNNDVIVYDGANWVRTTLPSCSNTTTSKLLYNSSTHAFSCGTDQDSGGGGSISGLTTGAIPKATSATTLGDSVLIDCGSGIVAIGSCGGSSSGTTVLGELDLTAKAAPSTPSAGLGAVYVDSTSKNLAVKNDAGTVNHGAQTQTAASNKFFTALSDVGAFTETQPAFTNLSGTATFAQTPQGAPASDDQVYVSSSTSAGAWKSVPDCTDSSGNHLNYTASSNTFSCGTTAPLQKIASGQKVLNTTAVSSATCSTEQTDTATGTATTDAVAFSFSADPTSLTGYAPSTSGGLTIYAYPKANAVGFRVCNNTAASITPGGSVTINYYVTR